MMDLIGCNISYMMDSKMCCNISVIMCSHLVESVREEVLWISWGTLAPDDKTWMSGPRYVAVAPPSGLGCWLAYPPASGNVPRTRINGCHSDMLWDAVILWQVEKHVIVSRDIILIKKNITNFPTTPTTRDLLYPSHINLHIKYGSYPIRNFSENDEVSTYTSNVTNKKQYPPCTIVRGYNNCLDNSSL